MIHIRKNLILPVLLSASFVAAQQVAAQPGEPRTKIVNYGDLNLAAPSGIATLDRRIHSAVRDVCGRSYPRDLNGHAEMRACQRESWANAQLQRNQAIAQVSVTQLAVRGQ